MTSSIKTSSPCRAKDPRTCPYHGAELKATAAFQRGDLDAALSALLERDRNKKYAEKEREYLKREQRPNQGTMPAVAAMTEAEKLSYLTAIANNIELPKRQRWEDPADVTEVVRTLAKYTPQDTIYDVLEFETGHDWRDTWGTRNVRDLDAYRAVIAVWQDREYLKSRAKNLLVQPVKEHDWKHNLRKEFATLLAEHGDVMPDGDTPYSWHDHSYTRNKRWAKSDDNLQGPTFYTVDAILDAREDSWDEFQDTFNGSEMRSGITGLALLSDGQVRKIRFETDTSDLIQQVTQRTRPVPTPKNPNLR